jgi:ADP-ribose pyrophosphatase YjhB (NUDIX family)
MDRKDILSELALYKTIYHEEKLFISSFTELIEKHDNCFERSLLSGHITGSAWVLNPTFSKALLVHHANLNRWLQPGGHADGDENLRRVSYKELVEETGLFKAKLHAETIFDLDIHLIPEHKKTPKHHHYDIRYLFLADEIDDIRVSKESKEVKWWELDNISDLVNHDRSIIRLVEKSRNLANILRKS